MSASRLGFRPSPAQMAYRRREVLRLWQAGCTAAQIGDVLDPPIDPYLVRHDLRTMQVRRASHRVTGVPVLPPRVHWLSPPADALRPAGGPGDPVAFTVRRFVATMGQMRAVSAHASDLADARLRGDTDWEVAWRQLLAEAAAVIGALTAQHEDQTGAAIRDGMTGWAQETARTPQAARRSQHRRSHPDLPPGLCAEVRQLLAAGLSVSRGPLAARYGVGENVIRWAHQIEVARAVLVAEGWTPPGS
jgi:hypothetical protein